jgi:hypothetical protein
MTTKRKAELQRKLALAPVAKPPADLADRIKSDIPKDLMLDANKERARFRQAIAFNVRVAASIILLVSSVYLALHLLSRKFGPQEAVMTAANNNTAKPVVLPNTPPPPVTTEAKAEAQSRKPVVMAESRREVAGEPRLQQQPEETRQETQENATVTAQPAAPALAESAPAAAGAPAPMIAAKAAAQTFDVEASAAPFDAAKQIVRVSLDGYYDTRPDVAFNDDAVASWHAIALGDTSLYEVTLRPHAGPGDIIATARVGNSERVIRRGDLRPWDEASRRMKAASLVAALDAGVPPKDVAAKARAAGLDDVAAAAEARGRKQPQ